MTRIRQKMGSGDNGTRFGNLMGAHRASPSEPRSSYAEGNRMINDGT